MQSRSLFVFSVCVFAVLISAQVLAVNFAPAVTYGSGGHGPNAVAVADLTGSGKPLDLVVANWCTDVNCTASSVGVLLGNGDGTFKPATAYPSGGLFANAVAVADVNGDGKNDIVVANCGFPKVTNCVGTNGNVGVLLGNGDGTFQPVTTNLLGGYGAAAVAVADLDGDNRPDLVVATNCVSGSCVGVLLGNGDGTFKPVVTYSSGGFTDLSVALADVSGDGKPDVVVANCSTTGIGCGGSNGDLAVLLNNGNGTFQAALIYGSGGPTPFGVAVGDVNGDGRPDIVAANCTNNQCGTGPGELGVLINSTLTATSTALTSSANPSTFGTAVTFNATVTPKPGFAKGPATGTVNFLSGTTSIGKSPLNGSGVATLTTSLLPVGTDSITATYGGDTNFGPSTSAALQQKVQGADYTVSANPKSATVNPGSSADYVITLSPLNGYDGTVTISCTGSLPAGVTCNKPSIGPGQTQATLTVKTTAPSAAALMATPDVNSRQAASSLWASLGGVGLVGMILAGDWKKRNRRSMGIILGVLAVVMILALVGCGGSSSTTTGGGGGGGGTTAGTYQLQVSATGTAGTHQGNTAPHPIPVTLVVN